MRTHLPHNWPIRPQGFSAPAVIGSEASLSHPTTRLRLESGRSLSVRCCDWLAGARRDGGRGTGERRLLGLAGDQEAAAERGGAEPRAGPAAQREVVSAAAGPAPRPSGLRSRVSLSPQGLRAGVRPGAAAAE